MIASRFLLFCILTISVRNQYSSLTYPTQMRANKIICNSPIPSASTTYTNSYSTPFPVSPLIALGISGMLFTPGLSIDFKSASTAITITNFAVAITLGASFSTISTINFHYLAIHPTFYNFPASPFYTNQLEWTGATLNNIQYGTGNRFMQISINRPALFNDFTHTLMCSIFILGLSATTTDNQYILQNDCYSQGSSTYINFKISVQKSIKITMLRVKFFAIDILALQMLYTIIVQYWGVKYENGASSIIIPTNYLSANTVVFVGLNSWAFKDTTSRLFDIDYVSGSSFSMYDANVFHYYFISIGSCHSGLQIATGFNKCFNGYNGCPFTSNQLLIIPKTTRMLKISKTNKYIVLCTNETLQIYKHNGVNYNIYQSIYLKYGCLDMAFNQDFSIIATTAVSGDNIFGVYCYNSTSQFWQLRYTSEGELSIINFASIEISQNGQSIVIAYSSLTPSNLVHYEFNTTTSKYYLANIQHSDSLIMAPKLLTQPNGQIKLFIVQFQSLAALKVSKKTYKSGKFYQFSQTKLQTTYSPNKYGWSFNGKVLAVLSQKFYRYIFIYQFDSITDTFIKHSSIINYATIAGSTESIKMDYEGLSLIVYVRDYAGFVMIIYKRNSLNEQFTLIAQERTFNIATSLNDLTKELIAATDFTGVNGIMKIYYCGSPVITTTDPQNGDTLMNTITMQPQITQIDLKISQTNKDFENQLQKIKYTIQNQRKQEKQALEQKQKKNNILIIVLFVLIIILSVIIGILGMKILKEKFNNSHSQGNKQIRKQKTNNDSQHLKSNESMLQNFKSIEQKNDSGLNVSSEALTQKYHLKSNQIAQQKKSSILQNSVNQIPDNLLKIRKKRHKSNNNNLESIETINFDKEQSLNSLQNYITN